MSGSKATHWPILADAMKSTPRLAVISRVMPASRFMPQLSPIALSAIAVMKPPWAMPRELVCGSASRTARMTASLVVFE